MSVYLTLITLAVAYFVPCSAAILARSRLFKTVAATSIQKYIKIDTYMPWRPITSQHMQSFGLTTLGVIT
jgi:hypothetical protein